MLTRQCVWQTKNSSGEDAEDEGVLFARQQQEADFAQRQDALLTLMTRSEWKAGCSRGVAEGMQSFAGAMQGDLEDAEVDKWMSAAGAKGHAAEYWESQLQSLQREAQELYHRQGVDLQATR